MESSQNNIKDVAQLAGVSIATVSRVIHQKPGFSALTLKKVKKAMHSLHYEPNKLAQTLKTGFTHTVAVSVPSIWHPFFSEFTYYLETKLNQNGYNIFLSSNESNPKSELSFLQMAKENKVDGIIAITYNDVEPYLSSQIPFVSIDRLFSTKKYPQVATITSDNLKGGQIAFRELVNRGSKKLAYIGRSPLYSNSIINRKKGFVQAAHKVHIPCKIFESEKGDLSINYLIDKLISQIDSIDGIFALDDENVYRILHHLKQVSISIPQDLQIIGYDGSNILKGVPSPISSIVQPIKGMAETAVKDILLLINHPNQKINNAVLPVHFRDGNTTRVKNKNLLI